MQPCPCSAKLQPTHRGVGGNKLSLDVDAEVGAELLSRTTNVLLRFLTSTSVGRRGCLLYIETGAAIASPLDGSARLTPNPGDAPDGRRTLTCLATLICTGRCT